MWAFRSTGIGSYDDTPEISASCERTQGQIPAGPSSMQSLANRRHDESRSPSARGSSMVPTARAIWNEIWDFFQKSQTRSQLV
jgi:hypothetical protein